MAHRKLFPKSGGVYLSRSEVIARLRSTFKHVEVDPHRGEAHVDKMIDELTRMQFLTPPPATPEEIERLRSVRGQTAFLTIYDDPNSEDAYLTMTVIPDEPLFIGFSSSDHEEASSELLERCATSLGYDVTGG